VPLATSAILDDPPEKEPCLAFLSDLNGRTAFSCLGVNWCIFGAKSSPPKTSAAATVHRRIVLDPAGLGCGARRILMKGEPKFWDNVLMKKVRQRIGVSQTALGQKLGLTQAVMSDLESGRTRISTDDALRIWGALSSLAPNDEMARSMAIAAASSEENNLDRQVEGQFKSLQALLRSLEAAVAFRRQAGAVKIGLKKGGIDVAFWKTYRDNYTVTGDPAELFDRVRSYIYSNIKNFNWETGGGEGVTVYKPDTYRFGPEEDAEAKKYIAEHEKDPQKRQQLEAQIERPKGGKK